MNNYIVTKGLWVKAGNYLLIELADYDYEADRKYSLVEPVKETIAFHQTFVNINAGIYE